MTKPRTTNSLFKPSLPVLAVACWGLAVTHFLIGLTTLLLPASYMPWVMIPFIAFDLVFLIWLFIVFRSLFAPEGPVNGSPTQLSFPIVAERTPPRQPGAPWYVVSEPDGVLVTQTPPSDGTGIRFDSEKDARAFVILSQEG